jgi:protein involved in ribonucleotide reduction
MLISSLETPNSSEAIMQGIENSVIGSGATIYTNQKVYLRALNGANVTATVTKVVAYGNQRWLFNYVNATGNLSGIFNLTPVVYSLDMKNMSIKAIRGNVTALINSTKI